MGGPNNTLAFISVCDGMKIIHLYSKNERKLPEGMKKSIFAIWHPINKNVAVTADFSGTIKIWSNNQEIEHTNDTLGDPYYCSLRS